MIEAARDAAADDRLRFVAGTAERLPWPAATFDLARLLQIVRTEGAQSRGQRLVQRLRNTATGQDVAGMSTDQIMALLRGD
jgi:hypothetical protein